MATFNKRGYKAPKPKEVDTEEVTEEIIDAKNSTTAGVFDSLDEGASRTEEWVAKNQKNILLIIGVVAIITAGYLLYNKFVVEPNNEEAANEMFQAQQYFADANTSTTAADSLYTLALNGGEGKFGFLKIVEKYEGTQAGNLANYYAGISYLRLKKYKEAISSLEKFSSEDELLNTVAIGSIGDAFAEIEQNDKALQYYTQASETSDNEFLKPIYLLKAGQTALIQKDKKAALAFFTKISEEFSESAEARNIDAFIGLAQ